MTETAHILAALDPHQRTAAQQVLGPVAILAGAGSGKTRTITHRIAYGINSGVYNPERVLALTYTRKASHELTERLNKLGCQGVLARTFHSLASEQLLEFWEQAIGGKRPQIIANKRELVAKTLENCAVFVHELALNEIVSEIEWAKNSLLTPVEYARQATKRQIFAQIAPAQLMAVMQEYEKLKTLQRVIDFEDVLMLCAGMIASKPEIATVLRHRHRYITVDEYQDISMLQQQLLLQWLGPENDNLCVVGDSAQTIFSFAGANQNFLLNFHKLFPQVKQIRLTNNYRSSSAIVNCANRLMRNQPGALTLHPHAQNGSGSAPTAVFFNSPHSERKAVCSNIRKQIDSGIAGASIAVLARTNAELEPFIAQLAGHGVMARTSKQSFYGNRIIILAIGTLRQAAVDPMVQKKPWIQQISDIFSLLKQAVDAPKTNAALIEKHLLNCLENFIFHKFVNVSLLEISKQLLELQKQDVEPPNNLVTLMPVHSAKGLEWDYVYVVGMREGNFPFLHASSSDITLAEERRLAYVAFTRARKSLYCSLAKQAENTKPSQFLAAAGIKILPGD